MLFTDSYSIQWSLNAPVESASSFLSSLRSDKNGKKEPKLPQHQNEIEVDGGDRRHLGYDEGKSQETEKEHAQMDAPNSGLAGLVRIHSPRALPGAHKEKILPKGTAKWHNPLEKYRKMLSVGCHVVLWSTGCGRMESIHLS